MAFHTEKLQQKHNKVDTPLGTPVWSRYNLRLNTNHMRTWGFVRRMARHTAQEEKRTIDTTRGKMTKIIENTRKNPHAHGEGGTGRPRERGVGGLSLSTAPHAL